MQRNQKLFESYDLVIQEQIAKCKKSMIKQVEGCKKFYLPHKAVIFKNAESGKLKIVCDATARENRKRLLLNDCLETGPTF